LSNKSLSNKSLSNKSLSNKSLSNKSSSNESSPPFPKCLLKTPDNETIMEKILNIFSSLDYSKYNLELTDSILLYPKNYLENFERMLKKDDLGFKDKIKLQQAGESLLLTVSKAIESHTKNLDENTFLFFIATDTPLITFEAVEDIIKRFSLLEGDLFLPFVSKEVYKVQFGKKLSKNRTFFKFSKDSFCSTGIFIVKNSVLNNLWEKFKTILEKRKNPIEIIKILGFDFSTFIKLILGNMTVLELEEKINQMFNIKAHGLLTNFANLAFNIDNKKDLENYNELVSSEFIKTYLKI
ncbi:MAG: hypothetical protein ACK4GR_05720, partial [bacterium]